MARKPPAKKLSNRTSKTGRTARRIAVAQGLVEGKPPARIAQDRKLSRSGVYKEIAAPETQLLIAGLLDRRARALTKLLDKAIERISAALDASSVQLVVTETSKDEGEETRTYETKLVGADHYARLTAVRRLLDLFTIGRLIPKPKDESGEDSPITYQQFHNLLERYQHGNRESK